MQLFLKGERGVGKSTLLRELLLPQQAQLAGFAVQRLLENGKQVGFRAALLDKRYPPLTAELPGMDGVFLLHGEKEVAVLDGVLAKAEALARKPSCKLVLLDEIGGIELTSPAFMDTLSRILSSGKPCIGVLKSADNLAHTTARLHLEACYAELRSALELRLLQHGELLTLTDSNRETARRHIETFILRVMG